MVWADVWDIVCSCAKKVAGVWDGGCTCVSKACLPMMAVGDRLKQQRQSKD
jgi:hypothetical protein